MQPSIAIEPTPHRHIIVKIVAVVVLLAVVVGAVFLVQRAVKQGNLEGEVKTELVKQNKLIKAAAKNDVFSQTLPSGVKTTDKVIINANVSISGTTYCIDGTSKVDDKIVFHMDKSTPENAPDKGTCSDTATVTPSVPLDVAVGSVGAGSINMTWNQSPYAASYTVQCATDTSFISGLKSQSASGTRVAFSNLDANTQYYCRVAAGNAKGQSGWSQTVTALTDAISVAPENMAVKTVSSSSLSYSWSPIPGVSTYILEYSTDISFATNTIRITTSETAGTLTGLKTYTAYYLHVKAITAGFDASHGAFSGMVLGRTAE